MFSLSLGRGPGRGWLLLALVAPATSIGATDCPSEFERHLATDLPLPFPDFDQTQNRGFRALADVGCNREAADLIERYIAANGTRTSLVWHVAQLRALDGDYPRAIEFAKRSISASEDLGKSPLRWNDYVRASIAFLERDRVQLVFYRDEVAKGKDAFVGNEVNLKLLDSLIRNFDKTYAFATTHIEDLPSPRPSPKGEGVLQ